MTTKDIHLTDEPLIMPMTPGSVLVRLAQVSGAIKRHPDIAGVLPTDATVQLEQKRSALLNALEDDNHPALETAFRAAQAHLCQLYAIVSQPGVWQAEEAATYYTALRFPDPLQQVIQTVNIHTTLATFSMPHNQVLTTLTFEPAAGATAYWLHEVSYFNDQRVQDAMIESSAPVFSRLRLPCGPHVLRIESRDSSTSVISDEFALEVPALVASSK